MADQKDKDTDEPIHFNEAYRRAKRNALFWAAATFALSWGHSDDGQIELTPLVRDLAFNHGLVVSCSLGIMGFMALGFFRASADIQRRNSNFQEDAFDTSPTADEVLNKIVDVHMKQLQTETGRLQSARVNAERAGSNIGTLIGTLPLAITDIDQEVDEIFESALVGHRTRDAVPMGEFKKARELARAVLVNWAENCRSRIKESRDNALKIAEIIELEETELPANQISIVSGNLDALKTDITNARSGWIDLQNFSDHLDQSKLSWHRWYDTRLTWFAIGTAMAVAITFLIGTISAQFITPGEWLISVAPPFVTSPQALSFLH